MSLLGKFARQLRSGGLAALVAFTGVGVAFAAPPTPSTPDPVFTTTCTNTPGVPATWTLWAGQTKNVGTVTVSNDATYLYVTYTLDPAKLNLLTPPAPDAHFGTLQLWVGTDPTLIPSANWNPIPGQFPYKYNEKDANGIHPEQNLTSYTFTIPLIDLSIVDATLACSPQVKLYVVTHAEVFYGIGFESGVAEDTAYGGDVSNPAGSKWWFYGLYCVQCANFDPPEYACKTAFAKGGYVFVTDRKSNPEGLPSLNLIKNRWGWAINLKATGETTYDIWAGAGLNKTSNGVKVGTLSVNWNGTDATIAYNLTGSNLMDEVHVYAGDFRPTTTAPGQYGNLAYFDPSTATYSTTIPVSDTNGDGIWLIAHAIACYPVQ